MCAKATVTVLILLVQSVCQERVKQGAAGLAAEIPLTALDKATALSVFPLSVFQVVICPANPVVIALVLLLAVDIATTTCANQEYVEAPAKTTMGVLEANSALDAT